MPWTTEKKARYIAETVNAALKQGIDIEEEIKKSLEKIARAEADKVKIEPVSFETDEIGSDWRV